MILLYWISIGCSLFYLLLLLKYRRLWNNIDEQTEAYVGLVSIIIPFRNEIHKLDRLCQSLNRLQYGSDLEIIFVDDHSEDDSSDFIKNYSFKWPIRVVELNNKAGKKYAIERAWEEIEAGLVLQTDADCELPSEWVKTMTARFSDSKVKFVSGPVNFYSGHTLFEKFMHLEFSALVAIGASHIYWNKPMLCNGANIAYRQEILKNVELKLNFASGEDVFLMQSVHRAYPDSVVFEKSKDALVHTDPPENLQAFIQQRMRWASKNHEYGYGNTLILMVLYLFHLLILVNLLSFTSLGLSLAAFLLIIKVIAELFFYESIADFFSLRNWHFTHLLTQFIHIPYMVFTPVLSKIVKFKWKGRRLT